MSFNRNPEEQGTIIGCTKITPSMVITGNINSRDNILADGKVYGDITTDGDLSGSNLIVGNIKAGNIAFSGSRIKGPIDASGTINITDNTVIIGDITADSIKVAGKVRGNINVEDTAMLCETALVAGDITAETVTMDPGARINGKITALDRDEYLDLEREFDLGGEL